MALTAGDGWLAGGANLLMFGPPGAVQKPSGGCHQYPCAGREWLARDVSCARPISFNCLQVARQELALESAIAKVDKYNLLVLDDLAYVMQGPGGNQRIVRVDRRLVTNAARC